MSDPNHSHHEKQHRFETNKKYYTISIYTIAVVLICALVAKLIFSWGATSALIRTYVSALYPIIFGFLIAYMLNPLCNFLKAKVFGKLFFHKGEKVRIVLSIIVSYIILLGLFILVFVFLIPQLYASVVDLWNRLQEWYSNPTSAAWVTSLQEKFPKFDVMGMMERFRKSVMQYLNSEDMGNILSEWMPKVFSTSVALFNVMYNIVFSLIVSVYVLIDKQRLVRNLKRLIHALFKEDLSRNINHTLRQVHGIFSGFIIGKTIDSTIIGVLCFILMQIFRLPYSLLISLIVGITNMIPYVGPFVGGIPGFVIILMLDPIKAFIYLVLVLLLQWFDGFYLGPRILGVSTGIRPVWIIFALCVGGAAAGVMGMFLGVPFVASIALLIDQWIDRRLNAKGISSCQFDSASLSDDSDSTPEEPPSTKE